MDGDSQKFGNLINIPSGQRLHNYGKSQILMGK